MCVDVTDAKSHQACAANALPLPAGGMVSVITALTPLCACSAGTALVAVWSVLQIPRGISQEQIRSICTPYGDIVDSNIMPPKRDNAMGESTTSTQRTPSAIMMFLSVGQQVCHVRHLGSM